MTLRIVPVSFAEACGFVAMHHRHHQPPVGHKFSLGVANDSDTLVGIAMVGRPVYTQAGETGASLRAAGWQIIGERPGRAGWSTPSRPRDDNGVDHMPRTLWEVS